MINADHILKAQGLKKTVCRKWILNRLLESGVALTENELKDSFSDLFDRVTFYRSLKTLEESETIHRVVLNNTTIKYALNDHPSSNIHPHFHCTVCDRVSCIESFNTNKFIHVPEGYKVVSAQILLEGICPDCSQTKKIKKGEITDNH